MMLAISVEHRTHIYAGLWNQAWKNMLEAYPYIRSATIPVNVDVDFRSEIVDQVYENINK